MLSAAVNIVLVHGAWSDRAIWNNVVPILEAGGKSVTSVDNQLFGLWADAAHTRTAIDALDGPTVVVGHAYGGAVITLAARDAPNVAALVYVAAFAPDENESLTDITSKFSPPSGTRHIMPEAGGMLIVNPAQMPAAFAADLPAAEGERLAREQRSISPLVYAEKMGPPAWKQHRSWFAVSEDDRMINPGAQRFMATRAKGTIVALKASHASPLSRPREIAGVILNACVR